LLWLDALGLGAYGVLGAAKAEAAGAAPLICIVMGALTACFGGVVRDLLAGQPSILLRREITVSAALLAATLFVGLRAVGLDAWTSAVPAALAGFALRAGALRWGWSLPGFPGASSR
ncbi:MAG: trimeric intracellular cation channel family protein, partial [Acetobacteraceae bacterium]